MGRKRSKENALLPKGVYRHRDNYVYRPYLGGGAFGKRITLCPVTAPLSKVHEALERIHKRERDSLDWLLTTYLESPHVRGLRPQTQRDYAQYKQQLCEARGRGGRFGDAKLSTITRRTIRGYLDSATAPVSANRQISFMSAAWNWCLERHDIPVNPCEGVSKNRERSRDRYVTQDEFKAFAALAHPAYVPLFMEIAYLCRARWSEVATMRVTAIREDGLLVQRAKGSRSEITAWTPRLRAAVDACRAYNASAPTPIDGAYLIHTKRGLPISYSTWKNAWRRSMNKWLAQDGERFSFHDIKAAGTSDQAENESGHKSARMRDVYVRKPQLVEPPK